MVDGLHKMCGDPLNPYLPFGNHHKICEELKTLFWKFCRKSCCWNACRRSLPSDIGGKMLHASSWGSPWNDFSKNFTVVVISDKIGWKKRGIFESKRHPKTRTVDGNDVFERRGKGRKLLPQMKSNFQFHPEKTAVPSRNMFFSIFGSTTHRRYNGFLASYRPYKFPQKTDYRW